jgi:hypothetical protein
MSFCSIFIVVFVLPFFESWPYIEYPIVPDTIIEIARVGKIKAVYSLMVVGVQFHFCLYDLRRLRKQFVYILKFEKEFVD